MIILLITRIIDFVRFIKNHQYVLFEIEFILILSILLIVLSCRPVTIGDSDESKEAEVKIIHFYSCYSSDNGQFFDKQTIFSTRVENIYICAFLDPQSTALTYKGQKLYLSIRWNNISSKSFFNVPSTTYQWVGAGWFYPVLEAPLGGFSPGIYEAELVGGRRIEATTTFEIVVVE